MSLDKFSEVFDLNRCPFPPPPPPKKMEKIFGRLENRKNSEIGVKP